MSENLRLRRFCRRAVPDGGASDVDNAALLCERRHTVVHQRRLWATVRSDPMSTAGTWCVSCTTAAKTATSKRCTENAPRTTRHR